jgi:AraC-like DNA-binding protein
MSVPCYSARFVRPFARVLSTYESFDVGRLNELKALNPLGRIPIPVAHELAIQQVSAVNDADLGLKAAQVTPYGSAGALEYAMNSAPTMRDALDVGVRFARIFCDTLRVDLDVDAARVRLRLHSSVRTPRTISDYAMATWYANNTRKGLGEGAKLECHFDHPKPSNTFEYDRTFGTATLHFDASWCGFGFNREYLDAPLPASDPAVHIVLCEYVSRVLTELHDRPSLVEKVRQIALKALLNGDPTVTAAASALHMSTRTLAGRLEREGTTFSALLDQTRRELALTYLRDPNISLSEVSFRLGFSHVEGFYRAFKRWTGEPPVAYRRKHKATTSSSPLSRRDGPPASTMAAPRSPATDS